MNNWIIQSSRKGKTFNVFDIAKTDDDRVRISVGDYSPMQGSVEMNIWVDKDEFMDIYYKVCSIYRELTNNGKQ